MKINENKTTMQVVSKWKCAVKQLYSLQV